jgi:hypothetical protein
MGWQDSRGKPPPKVGVYKLQRKDKTAQPLYSYWNGEFFNRTSLFEDEAAQWTNIISPLGGQRIWWEEGVDQPYMKANQEKGLPTRNGAAWTIEEEEQLLNEVRQGLSFAQIAEKHERVKRAIEIRFEKLNESKRSSLFEEARARIYNKQTADRWDPKFLESLITKQWNPLFFSADPAYRTPTRNKLLLLL